MSQPIIDAIQSAEVLLWQALTNPTSDSVEAAHRHVAEALRLIAAETTKPRCEALSCENGVSYSGIGRPRRYCSDACRKREFRASRQRQRSTDQQGTGDA